MTPEFAPQGGLDSVGSASYTTPLLITGANGRAQATSKYENTGPEPLASSARGSPVFVSSTMIFASQPNSRYDEGRIETDQRRVSARGGVVA